MFFPNFTQPQQFAAAWKAACDEQLARLAAFGAELERAEEQGLARAGEAIDESAKLMKASFRYAQELSATFRKQSLEVVKQATGMVGS